MELKEKVYYEVIGKYGEEAQLDMAIEEMSELTKEICKAKRGEHNHDAIVEELADVLITLDQLQIICNINSKELADIKFKKVERLEERLKRVN
ncbi:hypothetical protein [Longicatena caecimuris]|uniref:hypothetical protein n=1 Tax=Longicatena caecimuris TaxID=1796635 RepID=UPI002E2509FD